MITPDGALLLIIDVQGRLAQGVVCSSALEASLGKLVRACKIFEVPILLTEQYPKGLGTTVDSIRELLAGTVPIEKLSFSCCGSPEFMRQLRSSKRNDILVAGMEAHVCVYQTAMDLIEFGYNVHLVTDCVSSRSDENRSLGIRCIEKAGASLTSSEMAIFELLRVAGGERFKEISKIVKE